MKFTPEVIAALQTLKDAAENDFEHHRINVLERDLTAPPVVEVVDDTHQSFNGIVYCKDKSGHYRATFHIHREVYYYYTGNDLKGYDIHHKDFDADNNSAENLQKVTRSEHQQIHKMKGCPAVIYQEPKKFICKTCGKIFETTNTRQNTYCSRKCLTRNRAKEERKCVVCGHLFLARIDTKTKTCSSECRSKLLSKIHQKVT